MSKRLLSLVLVLALCLGLTSCGGGETKAATMHLRKTEGTVAVSDGEGKGVETQDNLGLYSGYGVDTRSESFAWIDLDDVKLTKMDQDSEIAITKEDKKLEIEVKSGSLFFNVTEPLADDESMNIRTSTMVAGIRGTCGWVTQDTAALLEGTVEVTAGEQSVTVSAGEMAFFAEDGKLDVRPLYEEDVPAFVAAEIGGQFPLEPRPIIPYAEENGLSFTKEKGYTVPVFTCFTDPSGGEPTTIGGLSITNVVDASYTIGDISVSEADADGMVQMTIPYHFDFTTTVTQDMSYEFEGDGRFYTSCRYTLFSLFDYYTGTNFPAKSLHGDADTTNAIEIAYKDVTYPVSYTLSKTGSDHYSDWDIDMDNQTAECQNAWSVDVIYTISMPKEYDGLCLYLYLPGMTEYKEPTDEIPEVTTLLESLDDGEDISDYALMRVSDLM